MPAPLKVHLSEEEDQELLEFQNIDGIPPRVKERAEIIRLNHHGWSVAAIAKYKQKSPHTVRASLHRWSDQWIRGLWEKKGRGRKRSWKEEDIKYLETCLETDERTYNAAQLSQKLAKERGVTLSRDRVRKVLKKRGGVGRGQDINNHRILTHNKKKPNKRTKNWLLWAHSAGEICLQFLDESGFCLWSPVSYTYARRGKQKVLEQTTRRGRRLNILGLYSVGVSFDYGLKLGSFKGDTYVKLLDWQAQKAAKRLAQTGQITVIVQDNHSHTYK